MISNFLRVYFIRSFLKDIFEQLHRSLGKHQKYKYFIDCLSICNEFLKSISKFKHKCEIYKPLIPKSIKSSF